MFWRRRRKTEQTLRTITEIAGDQIAPGAGKWFLIVGGLAVGAAATYFIARRRKTGQPSE